MDVGRAPDLYLNERARAIAPVRMTGNYGGELLRRIRAFRPVDPLPGLFRSAVMPYVYQAEETYAELLGEHPVTFAVFKQAPWYHHGVLSLEQTQVAVRSPFLDNDLVRLVFRAPALALSSTDMCLRLIADGDAELRKIRTTAASGEVTGVCQRRSGEDF